GWRRLPPESLPSPKGDKPAAIAAASPPLEPPGDRSRSYGLFVRPYTGLSVALPPPHGGQFVFPSRIPPAARTRATTVASRARTYVVRSATPSAATRPAVSITSLTVNGTPCSGPPGCARAARSAPSASSW